MGSSKENLAKVSGFGAWARGVQVCWPGATGLVGCKTSEGIDACMGALSVGAGVSLTYILD